MTGPIGLQTPSAQASLAKPAGAQRWELKRFGRVEIGFYHGSYTVDESHGVDWIKTKMGPNASAFVDVGYDVRFAARPPASQRADEVFQAYAFLAFSGPYLPKEVKDKKAARRVKPADNPPPDDPQMWEKARARLLDHEKGHITQAWEDMLNFAFHAPDLEDEDLTYEKFQEFVNASVGAMTQSVLPASRVAWDHKDVEPCTQDIKALWIEMPIKPA